ncbi:MAG: hypothetical protein V7642_164, partial [Burkholderiales bacterium]
SCSESGHAVIVWAVAEMAGAASRPQATSLSVIFFIFISKVGTRLKTHIGNLMDAQAGWNLVFLAYHVSKGSEVELY